MVIEPQSLVRLDLMQQLRDVSPDAQIEAFDTLEASLPFMRRLGHVTGVVVNAPLAEIYQSEFVEHVRRLGGWVTLLTDRHAQEVAAVGWHRLRPPFSSEMASRLFRKLLKASPGPASG